MSIRIRLLAVVAGALLAATGCKASCDDACNNIAGCAEDFGLPKPSDADIKECVSSCEEGLCGPGATEEQNQKALDCIADVECGSSAEQMQGKIVGCAFSSCI